MTLLAAENINKAFNDQIILSKVSFTVKTGDKIGFVGKNGSGKTTLFEILIDTQAVDSGQITKSKKCLIDYVEQEKTDYLDQSLFEFVASARNDLIESRLKIKALEESLIQNPSDKKALDELGVWHTRYEHANGFNFENDVKIILTGLGFESERYLDRIQNFSGGEKNRAGLARALAGNGNLILLDEPTNHLDIESTKWLEDYLNKTDRAFIVVSHDRTFLNNTINQVWELFNTRIEFYVGRFEKYLSERSERRRLHQKHYKHQQERIKQLEDFVRRNMAGQKTKQAQSKLKYLSRIKRLPPPDSDQTGPTIRMKSSGRSFAQVMDVEKASIGYGGSSVVDEINFSIYRGDKVGLIGRNGSGKSTLLKSLIGELSPISGEIQLGNNVNVAYFDQELSDLNLDKTVIENLWELDPYVEAGVIRSFLGRFDFSGEDSLKKVSTLSGGEKTKLSMARLLYHPANFIIFDEPTNHLDLISREALEKSLNEYDGSMLIVSHDRYFLNKVVNKIFHVHNGYLNIYDGDYAYFESKMEQSEKIQPLKSSGSKDNFLAFKEKSKQRSRLKKEIKATHEKIVALEASLAETNDKLENKIDHSDWELLNKTTDEKKNIENSLLELYEKLDQLNEINEADDA